MDPGYARAYRELYERHWWWRARERLILHELERLRPGGGWGRILDVGCGDGLFFDRLARIGEPAGVEPDAGLVTPDGRWRDRITVAPFDERFLPPHRYGLILFLDVLEHMDAPGAALGHAASLLAPGGVVLATVPAFRALWTSHDVLNEHRTRYRRGELVALLAAAGLRVLDARYFFHWLVPGKLAVRLREAVFGGAPRPPGLPPAAINRALERLSTLE
jgi:2-polyprenyl-3-methyl-5-hydroxy-6-metoxy-1,4-benzoquinol methylase